MPSSASTSSGRRSTLSASFWKAPVPSRVASSASDWPAPNALSRTRFMMRCSASLPKSLISAEAHDISRPARCPAGAGAFPGCRSGLRWLRFLPRSLLLYAWSLLFSYRRYRNLRAKLRPRRWFLVAGPNKIGSKATTGEPHRNETLLHAIAAPARSAGGERQSRRLPHSLTEPARSVFITGSELAND